MKNEKGITLIALIITIIVMLLLVGVTINVALNGGIFDKAQNAKEHTQVQTEKEELISIAVAAWDEKQNKVDSTKINLGNNFETTTITKTGKIVVQAKDTENLWQIDLASAKVEEYIEEPKQQETVYSFTINGLKKAGLLPVQYEDTSDIQFNLKSFKEQVGTEPFTDSGYINAEYGLYRIISNNPKIGSGIKVFVDNVEPTGNEEMLVAGRIEDNNFYLEFLEKGNGQALVWTVADYENFLDTYGDTVFTFVKASE